MRTYVGVTDAAWASFLRARAQLEEVNFWRPGAKAAFSALTPGEPFLFKTHYPHNSLIGGGFFEGFVRLRVSDAWRFFGEGNGVASGEDLRSRITHYRRERLDAGEDPEIGCVLLRNVVWFTAPVPAPPSFAPNVVQGKTYVSGEDAVVDHAVSSLLTGASTLEAAVSRRLADGRSAPDDDDSPVEIGGPTRGEPVLTVPRLHQGAFRALVLNAYEAHCAVTGHKIRPTLQAAHIRPVAAGGQHRVDNGLLLRSDIHTLFDLGYLTVDTRMNVHVSPRLRHDFGNGEELYARAEERRPILLPRRRADQPSREALEWHGDTIFLAS